MNTMSTTMPPAESSTERATNRRRRGDLPLALLCGAAALGLALDIAPAATAGLLALSILVVPGVFVVEFVRPRGPVERLIVVMAVSIRSAQQQPWLHSGK